MNVQLEEKILKPNFGDSFFFFLILQPLIKIALNQGKLKSWLEKLKRSVDLDNLMKLW